MAYIDSSAGRPASALQGLKKTPDDDDLLPTSNLPEEADEADLGPDPLKDGLGGVERLVKWSEDINLARRFDVQTLDRLGQEVVRTYEIDELSRADWSDKAERAMALASQRTRPKTSPWAGASNFIFPLISTAALRFHARTYPAVIQDRMVVKGTVWGDDDGTPATQDGKPDGQPMMDPAGQPIWIEKPGAKQARADRIGEHMSWQLLKEMPEWEPQTDQLLLQIPVIGGAAKKTYYDPVEKRNVSLFVSLQKLVWNYQAPSFERAPRHTEKLHYYPNEIADLERAGREDGEEDGVFLAVDYGPGDSSTEHDTGVHDFAPDENEPADASDHDAAHLFLEQHAFWDLDQDGYPEPYVVTVHHRSTRVVRIVARYSEETITEDKGGDVLKIEADRYYTLIPFLPSIDGGSYPMGFGHLLRSLNAGINTAINQMFDAGKLKNSGAGFIGEEFGGASGEIKVQVGKWIRVKTKGKSIRDAVFPIPFQGPDSTLFQLLGVLLEAGKETASIQDILTGDAAKANASPTTVLALIEQGVQVYTAIIKRVFRAMGEEYAKLYALNRRYLKEDTRFKVGDAWRDVTPDDYRLGGGVEPVADPSMVTNMQRLGRAQVLMSIKDEPEVNKRVILRRFLTSAGIERPEEIVPDPDPQAQQMAQQAQQLEFQQKTAELGRTRAAELKDTTQAMLNMAQARGVASQPEMDWIDKQLEVVRFHIEALNTLTRAAEVESKHHVNMSKVRKDAADVAHRDPTRGAGPGGSGAAPGGAPGADGGGLGSMASSPDNAGVPAIPTGPAPQPAPVGQ